MSSRFSYISTFAGCGGSSLGYKWAGGRGLAAVEFDANAVATYRANFPDTPVIDRDIREVTAEELMEVANLRVGELDILDGSPPCQGFSTAGKREIHDPRNSLFIEYVRLIEGLQPRVFVMENVSGMVKGKMKLVFREVMQCLKATGYRVRCKLLNAMYFNVPQSRERLIWIGVREDLQREASFPKAQSRPKTVREAIGHLPEGKPGVHSASVVKQWREKERFVGSFHSVRLDPDRPSPTQVKAHLNWHYAVPRQLTICEAGVIASFPEDFCWVGAKAEAKERIGNCVPPRFAQAIAEHIRDDILEA